MRPTTPAAKTPISGSIEDAQAKFNLRNLVASPAPGVLQLNVTQVQAFQRLLTTLGYDGAFAKRIALQVREPAEFGDAFPDADAAGWRYGAAGHRAGDDRSARRRRLPTIPA